MLPTASQPPFRFPLGLVVLPLLAALAGPVPAADFVQTTLAYRHGGRYTEPARPDPIDKHIVTVSHLRSGAGGSHFLSLEGRYSDDSDPAKGSRDGATEYLFNYRYLLPAGAVLTRPLAFGPVRDLALAAGLDLTTKDTAFAPRKRAWMVGPVLRLDVPGFLDLGLLYYQERNHKGLPGTPHPDLSFAGTYLINALWAVPVAPGTTFQGLFNRVGAKGSDFNDRPTDRETLWRTAVMFDLGAAFNARPKTVHAGLGYEWWRNKYGNPPGVGTWTRTPTLHLEWRL